MAQDYSGQLDKSNNAITAPKLSLHNLECWQINVHRCKTASYNMCEVTKSVPSGLVLAQQPWTYATKIKSKLRGWNLFQGIENGNRPQACIYVTPNLCCSLIPMFSNEDIVAIRVNNVCQKGDSFVFVSAYMAAEEPAPPNLLGDLLVFTEIEQIPTILGTDANAHHTIWGSSDINSRGKDLLAYCASAEADINEFQPFKASGPDGLYPVLLQKGWNQLKGYYHVIFQACLRHSNVPLAWKEGTGIFLPKLGKESPYDHFNFFSTEMLEKLFLYHINEDNNVQAKLSASQYGFHAGVATETALHEFVHRVEHCLV